MPTYSYRCSACGHKFDQFQRFSEDTLTECPQCHGLVKRVIHPVGVVFKGSGWYITDSRKSPPAENGGTDKGEKSDGKEAAKSDSPKSDPTKKPETSEPAKSKAATTTND
jgi:putative FmdB family regulatory protein